MNIDNYTSLWRLILNWPQLKIDVAISMELFSSSEGNGISDNPLGGNSLRGMNKHLRLS
jgi:hypothetical protein